MAKTRSIVRLLRLSHTTQFILHTFVMRICWKTHSNPYGHQAAHCRPIRKKVRFSPDTTTSLLSPEKRRLITYLLSLYDSVRELSKESILGNLLIPSWKIMKSTLINY